jgi:hypothetical protein
MPSHGQILLSIERLIRVADTLLANFNFDWGKARADVPIPEGSQVDRQGWDEYLKQHLSPMLPPTGYLPGFLDKVKSLLADMGTPGEPSVRRVLRLQFPSDDEKRCIKSLRVLKAELVAVKDREFLGVDRDTNPRTFSRQSGPRTRPKSLSQTDADRYKRIGREEIERMANPELWKRHAPEERKLRPGTKFQAFRVSLNRIRTFCKLPTSLEIRKKVTRVGHLESDQK